MDYGKYETERRFRSPHSKSGRYTPRLFLNILKALFVLCLFLTVMGASTGFGMVKGIIGNAPLVDILNIQPDRFATTVYDVAGNLIDTLVTDDPNHESTTYDELLQNLVNAFIVIGDSRFGDYDGIDVCSIIRTVRGVIGDDYTGGGSTITQQLIKNNVFFGDMESGWGAKIKRKLQEQYLAVQLEKNSGVNKGETKNLIIINYLNTINLGNSTLGVKVTAKYYSNKNVSDLTLSECAVLASTIKNSSKLNPISGRESNTERHKTVLQYMYDQGFISKEEQEEALAGDVYDGIQNVDTATKKSNAHYSYFMDELTEQVISSLMEKLDCLESQASNLLCSGELQIYTTQDPGLQAIADEEIDNPDNCSTAKYSVEYRLSVTHTDGSTQHYSEENLKTSHKTELGNPSFDGLYKAEETVQVDIDVFKVWLLKDGDEITGEQQDLILQPQISFVLMDQHTGRIKALCNGRGEKKTSPTLDRVSNVYRQPGSVFKVILVFAPAMDACDAILGTMYYGAPYTIGAKTFRNWWNKGYRFVGYHNIRDGIIYSVNTVAVRTLMGTVTPRLGIEYVGNMDISPLVKDDLGVATVLGGLARGVSNLGPTVAYVSIASAGAYTKPRFFTKILDRNGKVFTDSEPETKQILKDSTAFFLIDVVSESMKSSRLFAQSGISINSISTGATLTGMPTAGKNGTTTTNNDVWSVGYAPYYTVGIWGGCDSNQKLSNGNGGTSLHKDIWRNIMNRVYNRVSDPGFIILGSIETAGIYYKPEKRTVASICTADPRGSAVYTEYSAKGTAPVEIYDRHVAATMCAESGIRPTLYCSVRTTHVCMALPDGENDVADDPTFVIPSYCPIRTDAPTIINPNPDESGGDGPMMTPTGPGYQSPTSPPPTTEGYEPGNTLY